MGNWAQVTFLALAGTSTLAGLLSFVLGRSGRSFLSWSGLFVLSKIGEKKSKKKLRKT
jgi:hypothetical protein